MRGVVCEILMRDVEYLIERYLSRMRKVSSYHNYFLCLSVENDYKITFRRSAECIGTTRNRAWEFNLILLLIG